MNNHYLFYFSLRLQCQSDWYPSVYLSSIIPSCSLHIQCGSHDGATFYISCPVYIDIKMGGNTVLFSFFLLLFCYCYCSCLYPPTSCLSVSSSNNIPFTSYHPYPSFPLHFTPNASPFYSLVYVYSFFRSFLVPLLPRSPLVLPSG